MADSAHTPIPAPGLREFATFARDFLGGAGSLGWRAGCFTLLGALVEGIGLMLLLPLVNVLGADGSGSGWLDRSSAALLVLLPVTGPTAQLTVLLALFAVLMAIRGWAILHRDVLIARVQTGFVEALRLRVVEAMVAADWSVLARLRHGRIAHVLSNDIRACGLAAQLTLQSAIAAIVLAVQTVLALIVAPFVAAIVLALLAGGALAVRRSLRRSRQLGSELTESHFRLTEDTSQFLGGLKLAFGQNLQGGYTREFRQLIAYGAAREIAFARQRTIGQVALTSLAAAVAGAALLLGFGVFGASVPALIALLVILGRMSGPAAQLQQALQYIAHSLPGYEAIGAIVSELSNAARPAAPAQPAVADVGGPVVFAGVTYRHDASDARASGVRDLNLVLRPGEFVGVTGMSGAGKTTFVDLLVGLLAPQAGAVTVGGRPLVGATLAGWRARLSYVSQDPYLFHDTIAANLRWARPDASEADMADALALAGADALVAGLPEGVATVVGERGARLSGGERQRIALARALIRRPALLILDEATNAIDIAGEHALLARLTVLRPRPTILMIAHREQSLAACDRLLTFEAGRLIEPA